MLSLYIDRHMTCSSQRHVFLMGRSLKSHCLMSLSSLFSFYYETAKSQIQAARPTWVPEWKGHEKEPQPIPSGHVLWIKNKPCGCKPQRSWGYLFPQHNLVYVDWCTLGNSAGNMLALAQSAKNLGWVFRSLNYLNFCLWACISLKNDWFKSASSFAVILTLLDEIFLLLRLAGSIGCFKHILCSSKTTKCLSQRRCPTF